MILQTPMPCHMQAATVRGHAESAGLGAQSYEACVLEAHSALGLVTAVGPPHERFAASCVCCTLMRET